MVPDPIPENDNVRPSVPTRPHTRGQRPHPREERPSPSSTGRRLAVIITTVVLIFSVIGLVVFLVSNNDSNQVGPNPPTETRPEAPESTTNSTPPISWSQTAEDFRDTPNGKNIVLDCPPGGEVDTVYGTDLYTDDSSICTAAVHAGAISLETGGKVTISMEPGASQYSGSVRNGITSHDWNSPWDRSFAVLTGKPDPRPSSTPIGWDTTSANYSDQVGDRLVFECPPNGNASSIWGTGRYTSDSSICTAGVHAGKISFQVGGTVSIIIRQGASSFQGTTRNGVTSSDWGAWPSSFEVAG
ncbi:LCCL domain-containing protein [Streptomyces tibetensis]|uniref:LCCL domain-containing protein n=1 Tax=Streptomyces tibetensis TaxID=2382123 RepID=UPI003809FA06